METNFVGEQAKPAPAVWWHRAGDQFSIAKPGEKPFALCWEPLYDQSALDFAVRAERLRVAQLIAGEKFRDGKSNARRGPGAVGTWHESSPMGFVMRELSRIIQTS